jgi:hypothetical protein
MTHAHPECDRTGINTAAVFHLVCPALEFLDKGKTRLNVPAPVAAKTAEVLWSVTQTLYREEQRRQKDAVRAERQAEARGRQRSSLRVPLTEAVPQVAWEAYQSGTGGDKYQLSVRDYYYELRPLLARFGYAGDELDFNYFSQTLLPEYRRRPDAPPMPLLYYKPRGVLYEPHAEGRQIEIGTREVEDYEFPAWRFNKILYIEKQGVWEALKGPRSPSGSTWR